MKIETYYIDRGVYGKYDYFKSMRMPSNPCFVHAVCTASDGLSVECSAYYLMDGARRHVLLYVEEDPWTYFEEEVPLQTRGLEEIANFLAKRIAFAAMRFSARAISIISNDLGMLNILPKLLNPQ